MRLLLIYGGLLELNTSPLLSTDTPSRLFDYGFRLICFCNTIFFFKLWPILYHIVAVFLPAHSPPNHGIRNWNREGKDGK